jgi:hypothetical protein
MVELLLMENDTQSIRLARAEIIGHDKIEAFGFVEPGLDLT